MREIHIIAVVPAAGKTSFLGILKGISDGIEDIVSDDSLF